MRTAAQPGRNGGARIAVVNDWSSKKGTRRQVRHSNCQKSTGKMGHTKRRHTNEPAGRVRYKGAVGKFAFQGQPRLQPWPGSSTGSLAGTGGRRDGAWHPEH